MVNVITPIAIPNQTEYVYPYESSYIPIINVPIVSGDITYDKKNCNTYTLVFQERLYYGSKLQHSLINPNHFHHNGVALWENTYDMSHELLIETNETILTLHYHGTKLCFRSRVPTK